METTIDFSKRPAMRLERDNRCVIRSVKPENVFHFPNGIMGFEKVREFYFLMNEKHKPFMFMQALEDASLTFVCVEPFVVRPDFNVRIPDDCIKSLDLKKTSDALVLCLVTVRQDVKDITVNLRSPIILNMVAMSGTQVILDACDYPIRYRIWDSLTEQNKIRQAG